MKKVLITGAAGMVGSYLSEELLKRGYQITGIDNLSFGKKENLERCLNSDNFSFVAADVLDLEAIKKLSADMDIIIHLAALKKPYENDPTDMTLRVNADGTRNILEAARDRKIKVVFSSTSDVYGGSRDLPFREDGALSIGPSSVSRWSYAVSKLYAEQAAFSYYRDYGVPVVVLRYFGCFSMRSNLSWSGGHVPLFIDAVLKDEEIIVHGDGKQTRCMALVDDVVTGTILAMENERAVGEIFNIGSDEEINIADTAVLIHRLANTGREIKFKYKSITDVFGKYKEIMRRVPDLSKSESILGFSLKFSFEQALKLTIDQRKKELGLSES